MLILININETDCDINIVIKDFSALLNEISFDKFGRTYKVKMIISIHRVLGLIKNVKGIKLTSI